MNWKSRSKGMLAGLVISVFCTGLASAAGSPENVVLSWSDDPAHTITASWTDGVSIPQSIQIVRQEQYEQTEFQESLSVAADCRDISLDHTGKWHYEAEAKGLEPGMQYVYRVGHEGAWSEPCQIRTDNPLAEQLTFSYMGDIQTAQDAEQEYELWGELAENMYRCEPNLSFTILGGDIVESGISLSLFQMFFQNASPVFSKIPLMATNGNHECNFMSGRPELYLDFFALPTNGPEGFEEEFYSFDVANCHILVLNSWALSDECSMSEDDRTRINSWISHDLLKNRADWQIAVTHVPIYELHNDKTAKLVRKNWAPILEDCGVDLVLEGHQHLYSRSVPMYHGARDDKDGLVYVMGNSGKKFYSSADESFSERVIYGVENYQIIRALQDRMILQCYDREGNELDYAELLPRDPKINRLKFIETLWEGAGKPTARGCAPFADVDASAACNWAFEQGLIFGYGNGNFGPFDQLKPEHMDLILDRMEGKR